jgi:hypothetical protein
MAWKINKSGAKFSAELTDADQKKWDAFQNEVHHGTHPKEAAKKHRCDDYKVLSGNQYQIRLSGKQRATFLVDEKTQTVTVKQVGGHT